MFSWHPGEACSYGFFFLREMEEGWICGRGEAEGKREWVERGKTMARMQSIREKWKSEWRVNRCVCIWVCVGVCRWRPDWTSFVCLSFSVCYLLKQVSHWMELHGPTQSSSSTCPCNPLPPPSGCWAYKRPPRLPCSPYVWGESKFILMLMQQVVSPLSHLSSANTNLFIWLVLRKINHLELERWFSG